MEKLINETTDLMEKKLIYNILDIKGKLKSELDQTKKLLSMLKSFEK